LGNRDTATGNHLWDVLQDKEIQQVMTDFWKPYEHFVPSDIHIQSKAETYTVEGYNSLFGILHSKPKVVYTFRGNIPQKI
jgi:insertion element IS1 protein InsB